MQRILSQHMIIITGINCKNLSPFAIAKDRLHGRAQPTFASFGGLFIRAVYSRAPDKELTSLTSNFIAKNRGVSPRFYFIFFA